jgi:predicted NUDIX family NTP pyrophosphohydrolase
MAKQSAGLLVFRRNSNGVDVFLVHPGGPFWQNKDAGAWSIPKGEFGSNEDPLVAAKREFHEETGLTVDGQFTPLTPIKQRGGKVVYSWIVESDFDATIVQSNRFSMEWPPGSGRLKEFPEVDRAEWFALEAAKDKILDSQRQLLDELRVFLARQRPEIEQ